MLKSINPYTNLVLNEFEELTPVEADRILNRSSIAFENWKRTDFRYRKELMDKAASILKENIAEYSNTITLEMGKPVRESRAEVEKCAWVCGYYSENAEKFLQDEQVDTGTYKSFVRYEPMGVILGIMPWNFPFWQVFRFAVPPLMAGNTVLLKHASNVQMCARHIEEVFIKAGFPPDIFMNLRIGSARMEEIICHNIIKAVSLTGSEYAGQKVAETAGRNIKKSVLELGGSNAFIVLDDADIEKSVEKAVISRMSNAGQSCISAKRFIVHKKISDDFITLFRERVTRLTAGDPLDENTEIGPLASRSQAEIVDSQVNRSLEMGARLITGGGRIDSFYSPSIMIDVNPGMPVFYEEVFGPVAPIVIARDTSEAIKLAGSTKYGLGVTIFTGDPDKALNLVSDFKDGAVFINEIVKSDPRLPFGGTGRSGYGRELALHGIREFVNVKTVYASKA